VKSPRRCACTSRASASCSVVRNMSPVLWHARYAVRQQKARSAAARRFRPCRRFCAPRRVSPHAAPRAGHDCSSERGEKLKRALRRSGRLSGERQASTTHASQCRLACAAAISRTHGGRCRAKRATRRAHTAPKR
jgi:hypothetical protein